MPALTIRGNSTMAPGALGGASATTLSRPTITEAEIDTTIANWDVQACGQRIFVARLRHEMTSGGIVLPETAQEDQCDAIVISAGPLAYINDLHPTTPEQAEERRWMPDDELNCATRRFLKPGDRITFGKWSGETVRRKGTVKKGLDTLMVMNADDCIGKPEVR